MKSSSIYNNAAKVCRPTFPAKKALALLLVFFALNLLLPHSKSFAEQAERADLTQEDKAEKRLRFNRYVEQALAERVAKRKKKEKEKWSFSGSAAFGYDNNVALDARRDGDTFHEETADLSFTMPHTGIPDLLGAGDFGAKFHTDFRDYSDHDDFDYNNMRLRPFFKTTVLNRYRLEVEYTLESLRYIRNNQINYVGHRGKARLMESLGKQLAHRVHFQYRIKDYIDRKAKSAVNTNLSGERKDDNYDAGYEILYFPDASTYASVMGAWLFNESNDLHRDFNDYQGYRISGFLYRKFAELFSWTIAGGYQFKAYDARTFTGSGSAQRDEYFYIANYVNVPLTDNTQLVFQHLYNQNASNNPIHDYSSSQMSLGLSVRF